MRCDDVILSIFETNNNIELINQIYKLENFPALRVCFFRSFGGIT